LPHISAGWIVSGAADPAVGGKDHRRNFCADGIGDIAAAKTVVAADGISRTAARAIAVAIIVNPAVETEAAVVTVAVTAKETAGATTAAVESGDAPAMKAAPAMNGSAVKSAMKAAAVKTAADAASRVSGSGE
jgi:hypothetical protein